MKSILFPTSEYRIALILHFSIPEQQITKYNKYANYKYSLWLYTNLIVVRDSRVRFYEQKPDIIYYVKSIVIYEEMSKKDDIINRRSLRTVI